LTIVILPAFGQNFKDQFQIEGIIIDSITSEPIPFASIRVDSEKGASSYFDGTFILKLSTDSIIDLAVSATGYFEKEFQLDNFKNKKTIRLKPIPLGTEFEYIIWGRPIDTSYFENGHIKIITYSGRDQKMYYESGKKKSESVNGSFRTWFENGQLKYQSILKFNHHRTETEWYKNGQIKAKEQCFGVIMKRPMKVIGLKTRTGDIGQKKEEKEITTANK